MENLAYLHLSFANVDSENSELISLSSAPNWQLFSSSAWKYMIPLVLTLSILNSVSSVLALDAGNQETAVHNLQPQNSIVEIETTNNTVIETAPTIKEAGNQETAVPNLQPQNSIVEIETTNNTVIETAPTIKEVGNQESAVHNFQPQNSIVEIEITNNTVIGTAPTIKEAGNQESAIQNFQPQNSISEIEITNNKVISTAPTTSNNTSYIIPITNKRKNPNFFTKGDEGAEVRILQQRLRIAGFYHGNPTGVFGPITEEAVKRFQRAYNLTVDGIAGKSTLGKLPAIDAENGTTAAQKLDNRDTLSLGDRGEAVRILQEQLIKAGFLQSQSNGYYGSNTVDAVTRFQKQHQLEANGMAGQTTRSKLYNLVRNSAKSDFTTLEIQRRLHEKGFYKGQINGMMANDTKKAISRAQEFYGISLKDIKNGSF